MVFVNSIKISASTQLFFKAELCSRSLMRKSQVNIMSFLKEINKLVMLEKLVVHNMNMLDKY